MCAQSYDDNLSHKYSLKLAFLYIIIFLKCV